MYPMVLLNDDFAKQAAGQNKDKIDDIIKIVNGLSIKEARVLLLLAEKKVTRKTYEAAAKVKVAFS